MSNHMDTFLTGLGIVLALASIPLLLLSSYFNSQRRKLAQEGPQEQVETPAPAVIVAPPPPAPEKPVALNGVTVGMETGQPVARWTDIHIKVLLLMLANKNISAREIQRYIYGTNGGRQTQEVAQMIRDLKAAFDIDAVPSVPVVPRSTVPEPGTVANSSNN